MGEGSKGVATFLKVGVHPASEANRTFFVPPPPLLVSGVTTGNIKM